MSEQTFLLILSSLLVIVIVAMLAFLSAVLWQLVKILREVRGIMANIRVGSDTLKEDLANLRQNMVGTIAGVAARMGARRSRAKKASAEPHAGAEE